MPTVESRSPSIIISLGNIQQIRIKVLRDFLDRIEGLGLSTETDSNSGHSGRAFQAVVHALRLQKASSWILSLFRKQHPRLQKFAELTLDSLCDIQVVTGSAIIVAGLVQINTMTFYHQQLVMNYWFLTLNSFWAGRMGDLNQNEDNDDWHYWTRKTAILCTVLLSAIFQIIVIPNQPAAWNPVSSGSCYISHDKSTYDSQILRISGLVFFAFYLVIVLLSGLANLFRLLIGPVKDRKPTWVENSANNFRKIQDRYSDRYKEWRETVLQVPINPRIVPRVPIEDPASSLLLYETKNRFIQPFQFIVSFILYSLPVLYWLFLRFLGLWSWGETTSVLGNVLMVMAYFGFAAWSTYDIIDLKLSNAYLVQDESAWGFGQVLPVVLLGLIVLNMFDAAKDS